MTQEFWLWLLFTWNLTILQAKFKQIKRERRSWSIAPSPWNCACSFRMVFLIAVLKIPPMNIGFSSVWAINYKPEKQSFRKFSVWDFVCFEKTKPYIIFQSCSIFNELNELCLFIFWIQRTTFYPWIHDAADSLHEH